MQITEVRIKLMEDGGDRLKAFCSITFDDSFVVRDLKIIEGSSGPFVAMPSRKLTAHCPKCGYKNHLRAQYCNQCGARLEDERANRDDEGRAKLYADIAHPINSECREMIQTRVIEEFQAEQQLASKPGYTSRYDDYDYEGPAPHISTAKAGQARGEPSEPPQSKTEQRERNAPRDPAKPHVEQGEAGPPPPHKRPSDAPARRPDAPEARKKNGGFGEGIF